MSNQLWIVDNNRQYQVGDRAYLVDENHIYRQAEEIYLNVGGIYKLVYQFRYPITISGITGASGTIRVSPNPAAPGETVRVWIEGADYDYDYSLFVKYTPAGSTSQQFITTHVVSSLERTFTMIDSATVVVSGSAYEIHDHNYTYSHTTATCTDSGYDVYKCACGDEKYEYRAALGHVWNNGVCDRCGEVCSHNWSNGVCTICGYECSHNFAGWYYDPNDGANGHFQVCTICGVGGNGESHNFDTHIDQNNGTHIDKCSKCDYTKPEPVECNYSSSDLYGADEGGHACTECGNYQHHIFDKYEYVDAKNHRVVCSVCGYYDDSSYKPHEWDQGVCKDCEHICEHPEVGYKNENDGTHTIICSICGTEIRNESCSYEPYDDTYHKCKHCNHKEAHIWDDAGECICGATQNIVN